MRFWTMGLTLAAAGCGSVWELADGQTVDTGCEQFPYYLDVDGDGWGDAHEDGILSCQANTETNFTAQNNEDCDDSDSELTGRLGDLCPDDFLDNYAIFDADDVEYLIALPGSETQNSGKAADYCEAAGWGGFGNDAGLAVLDSTTLQDSVSTLVPETSYPNYAAWIGFGPHPGGDDSWTWADESSLGAGWTFCDSELGDSSPVDDWIDGLDYLTVVLRSNADPSECIGVPEDALEGADSGDTDIDDYSMTEAHYICSRAKPDPTDLRATELNEDTDS